MNQLDIICFSTAPWNARILTNRQRLMGIYADQHRVLYVEPGLHSREHAQAMLTSRAQGLLPTRWLRQEQDTLWVYSPGLLPLYRLSPWAQHLAWKITLAGVRRFCSQMGFTEPVLWFYSPEAQHVLGHLNERLSVYDCVDNYAATPYYAKSAARAKRFRRLEAELLCQIDIVTTTSQPLYVEKLRSNPNTHLVENVGDHLHFARALEKDTPIAAEIAQLPRPVIGYIGAVNQHKMDFALIAQMARTRPEWQIVLIGPVGGWGGSTDITLLNLPNIHLLGKRDYAILPSYLKGFNVGIIPYRLNDYTQGVFPLKFFEMLAAGLPVVATDLPALRRYQEHAYIGRTPEEFTHCVEQALAENSAGRVQARTAVAGQHTWRHRADTILKLIEHRLTPQDLTPQVQISQAQMSQDSA